MRTCPVPCSVCHVPDARACSRSRSRLCRFVLELDTPTPTPPDGVPGEWMLSWRPKRSRGVTSPINIVPRCRRVVVEDNKLVNFASGAISGLVADAVTHPIDTIRTRLWVQGSATMRAGGNTYSYGGLLQGFVMMIRAEGLRSLFKGFGSVALLTPLAHGLYFGSYGWAKRVLVREEENFWGMSEPSAIMSAGTFGCGVWGFGVWGVG